MALALLLELRMYNCFPSWAVATYGWFKTSTGSYGLVGYLQDTLYVALSALANTDAVAAAQDQSETDVVAAPPKQDPVPGNSLIRRSRACTEVPTMLYNSAACMS